MYLSSGNIQIKKYLKNLFSCRKISHHFSITKLFLSNSFCACTTCSVRGAADWARLGCVHALRTCRKHERDVGKGSTYSVQSYSVLYVYFTCVYVARCMPRVKKNYVTEIFAALNIQNNKHFMLFTFAYIAVECEINITSKI